MTDSTEHTRQDSAVLGKTAAIIALLLGLAITAAIWNTELRRARAVSEGETTEAVGVIVNDLKRQLLAHAVALRGGASLFAITEKPSREQWRAYVDALRPDDSSPAIRGFAFAALVSEQERAEFEREQSKSIPGFRIWPQGPRDEYGVVTYIEPMDEPNRRALGYDMWSDPTRHTAMRDARQSGEPQITGPVTLVQDVEQGHGIALPAGQAQAGEIANEPSTSVLIYVPIYRGSAATAHRAEHLIGWVYGPLRPASMLQSESRRDQVAVRLYDVSSEGASTLLYSDPRERFEHAFAHEVAPLYAKIEFAGRQWLIEARPASGADVWTVRRMRGLGYAAAGVVVSLLLFGVIWSMATTGERAHILATSMTEQLRGVNESLDRRVRARTADLQRINDHLRSEIAERELAERARSVSLEREARRNRQLRALADSGLGFALLPDARASLDFLVNRICSIVGCDHALFVPADASQQAPTLASLVPSAPGTQRLLRSTVLGWPRPAERLSLDAPWEGLAADALAAANLDGESEVIGTPVSVGRDSPLGWLYLVQPPGQRLGEEDQAVLSQIVLLAATSIRSTQLAEEERQARLDAEQANATKDQFLAIVSHELRTPLHAILGWLSVIERQPDLSEQLQHAVRVIRRNADAQSVLVDDLLDLARVEQGKLEVERSPVDFAQVVTSVVDSHRHVASERQVELECSIDAGGVVIGDEIRLQQVVGNLISNALKFTPTGGKVSVRLDHDEALGGFRLEVADTGIGIEPALLEQVFERFAQADTSSRRRQGGLGLGLALVRHLVELHGGHVRAYSDGAGKGARFAVWLPIAQADGGAGVPIAAPIAVVDGSERQEGAPALATAADEPNNEGGSLTLWPDSRPAGEQPFVIVIDDHDDARAAACEILAGHGYRCEGFPGVDEALSWLRGHPHGEWPRVAVCDIEMPLKDGFQFVDELRELERDRGAKSPLSVIAYTAYTGQTLRQTILLHGFVAHLPKSAGAQGLVDQVRAIERGIDRRGRDVSA